MKKIIAIMALMLMFTGTVWADDSINEQAATQLYYRTEIVARKVPYTNAGFFSAIQSGNTELTEMFLKSGYSPNIKYMKLPAIFAAVYSRNAKIVDLLLKYGADVDTVYIEATPLIFAINRKDAEIVDVLIKHDADVNKSSGALKPLNYALKKKHSEIVTSLLNAGALPDDESLIRALKNKDENIKNLVLKKYRELE